MLTNIPIERILPHPNNPRQNLGDLTELAASIKERGILQNLTVIPQDPEQYKKMIDSKRKYQGNYIAIIGHRRHAASKLAGLNEIPCTVAVMDDKEQIATMLLENIQRSDLTPIEQAQGFQLMMNFGETAVTIAEKTGFSKSTVYSRVKLLEFDPDKLKAAEARGGTLADYAALDKIEDKTTREKVLDKIGTSNFKYELQSAIDTEKREKKLAKIIEDLEKFATKVKSDKGLQYVRYLYQDSGKIEVPPDADTVKYYFTKSGYCINLLCDKTAEKPEEVLTEKEKAKIEHENRLKEITARMYKLRLEFVKGISDSHAKKHLPDIAEYILKQSLDSGLRISKDSTGKLLEAILDDKKKLDFDALTKQCVFSPSCTLLYAAMSVDCESSRYYDWELKHNPMKYLDERYDFLCKLGYEMSDEELAMRDGTHELFGETEGNDE